jgi:hypothetical protein
VNRIFHFLIFRSGVVPQGGCLTGPCGHLVDISHRTRGEGGERCTTSGCPPNLNYTIQKK